MWLHSTLTTCKKPFLFDTVTVTYYLFLPRKSFIESLVLLQLSFLKKITCPVLQLVKGHTYQNTDHWSITAFQSLLLSKIKGCLLILFSNFWNTIHLRTTFSVKKKKKNCDKKIVQNQEVRNQRLKQMS